DGRGGRRGAGRRPRRGRGRPDRRLRGARAAARGDPRPRGARRGGRAGGALPPAFVVSPRGRPTAMRPTLILPAIAGVAVALGLGGCGGKAIHHGDLQETVGTQLSQQGGGGPAQVSVSWPEGQKVEQGNEFDCELTAPNGD